MISAKTEHLKSLMRETVKAAQADPKFDPFYAMMFLFSSEGIMSTSIALDTRGQLAGPDQLELLRHAKSLIEDRIGALEVDAQPLTVQ